MIIAGTDGSEMSIEAVNAGLALVAADEDILLVTVVDHADASLVTGSGMAGGVMSDTEFDELEQARTTQAETELHSAAAALIRAPAESVIGRGDAGRVLCDLAEARSARAIVLGTRGRSGVKRALLGSVSDYVVRNAPCPVVITRPTD